MYEAANKCERQSLPIQPAIAQTLCGNNMRNICIFSNRIFKYAMRMVDGLKAHYSLSNGYWYCWCRRFRCYVAHAKHSNNARNFIIATRLFGILSLYYYHHHQSLEAHARCFILLPISLLLNISVELTHHVYFDELKFRFMSFSWDFLSQMFRCNVKIDSVCRANVWLLSVRNATIHAQKAVGSMHEKKTSLSSQ